MCVVWALFNINTIYGCRLHVPGCCSCYHNIKWFVSCNNMLYHVIMIISYGVPMFIAYEVVSTWLLKSLKMFRFISYCSVWFYYMCGLCFSSQTTFLLQIPLF